MKRVTAVFALGALSLALLSACGEKPQTLGGAKQDAAAYTGVGTSFSDPQWKQRDRAAWESHLKARAQQGQNDYSRMN
ncbi:hypothetical protein [Rhodoferax sp.]|uniref:hypothetical protein n=1 Tax=Rhodoferax sp. TaxID=50421 RepID=UPI0027448CCA|nr:hypothetical protein [Rhodoferax sp.]